MTPALEPLRSPGGVLTAQVAPSMGSELCGLQWSDGETRHELLYRGLDFSPVEGWTGRAPLLWPAIGRTFAPGPEPTAQTFKTAELGWTVDGVPYPMVMHGFARQMAWTVDARTTSSLRTRLTDSDRTRVWYPFGFDITIDFDLTDEALIVRHTIVAGPDNNAPMPFALGNHATFKTPLRTTDRLADTRVQATTDRRLLLDATGRPTGEVVSDRTFADPQPADTIERYEVIALPAEPGHAEARLTSGDLSVGVSHHAVGEGDIPDEIITLWGDVGAGYLSLEAWLGHPNALASGISQCRLAPGQSLTWILAISVSGS